jgi:hypothetical protein
MNLAPAEAVKNIKNAMAQSKKLDTTLHKVTVFLAGFFISTLLNVILLKITSSFTGLYIGIAASYAYTGWVFYNKIAKQKRLAAGVLTAAILFSALLIALFIMVEFAFQGIAS